jgi:hypothetical protein
VTGERRALPSGAWRVVTGHATIAIILNISAQFQ